ncbi:hypothetical protein EAG18_18785 [Pseudoalteromonas sp. J010]|nr:hypothetical protein EAG18_18785 [Pseudoalteromonas sp. J010]
MRRENLVDNSATASCYLQGTYIRVGKAKISYLVVLNKKFFTLLASDLLLQIEQVLSQIGIKHSLIFRHQILRYCSVCRQ